jgi:hypothetical protein
MSARATNNLKRRSDRKRPWESITPMQYQRGWELVSTGHTIQQVLAATGLTRPQLAWLMKVGDDAKGMPSYHARIAEQAAIIRSRAQKAADYVGIGAVESLKSSVEISKLAQEFARNALAAHIQHRVKPAITKIKSGQGTDEDLQSLAMPKGLRETMKMLRPYTDFSEVARSFRIVFDSPHQRRDPLSQLPKEVRLDLSGEAMLPATVALVEELDQGASGHDLLDDMLPEYKGWTANEIEHFLETGERPNRDYGEIETPVLGAEVIDAEATQTDE